MAADRLAVYVDLDWGLMQPCRGLVQLCRGLMQPCHASPGTMQLCHTNLKTSNPNCRGRHANLKTSNPNCRGRHANRTTHCSTTNPMKTNPNVGPFLQLNILWSSAN